MRILIASIALLFPVQAASPQSAMGITTSVLEQCQVSSPTIMLSPLSTQSFSTATELCNRGGGFAVLVHHRPLGETEEVRIAYGDGLVELSASGTTRLAQRLGARRSDQNVFVEAVSLEAPIELTFGIEITTS